MVEREFQVVERQTQVAEHRSGPFRLNLTTANGRNVQLPAVHVYLQRGACSVHSAVFRDIAKIPAFYPLALLHRALPLFTHTLKKGSCRLIVQSANGLVRQLVCQLVVHWLRIMDRITTSCVLVQKQEG